MRLRLANIIAVIGFALGAGALAAEDAAPDPALVRFQWGVRIPMRDGVHLNATAYIPAKQKSPAPCVFTLTPYIAQSYHDRGMYFAANGYPFFTVDVRGRGNSEGTFRPFIQEGKDGHDIVEWIAAGGTREQLLSIIEATPETTTVTTATTQATDKTNTATVEEADDE